MISFLRMSTATLALLAAAPFASAQTTIIEGPERIQLAPSHRTIIQRYVVRERRPVILPPRVELRVGEPIPRAVELYSFPDEIYAEVPPLRRYRYFYADDEVVLVDPDTSEIVEIIRE